MGMSHLNSKWLAKFLQKPPSFKQFLFLKEAKKITCLDKND